MTRSVNGNAAARNCVHWTSLLQDVPDPAALDGALADIAEALADLSRDGWDGGGSPSAALFHLGLARSSMPSGDSPGLLSPDGLDHDAPLPAQDARAAVHSALLAAVQAGGLLAVAGAPVDQQHWSTTAALLQVAASALSPDAGSETTRDSPR